MEGISSLVAKNLQYYRNKALVELRSALCPIIAPVLQQPIFIIGCSRAGTTLVYKTFSESKELGSLQKETHDFWGGLHPAEERNWETHAIPEHCACEADRKIVSRYFYTQTGKARIVDKNNQNGLSVHYLFNLFPDAHFVFIKRSPGDNIHSLIQGWGKESEFGAWSRNLPETLEIDGGRYRRWCFFLAEGWRRYVKSSIEEVCAFQYVAMNEAIFKAKEIIPEDQWHELCYEGLIANPIDEFRKVFKSCNINFNDHLRYHCSEVTSKPYNAFSEIRVDKWKEGVNRNRIERVLPIIKETAEKLGYSVDHYTA